MLGRKEIHVNAQGNEMKELYLMCEALVNTYGERIGCTHIVRRDGVDGYSEIYPEIDGEQYECELFTISKKGESFQFKSNLTKGDGKQVSNVEDAINSVANYFDDRITGVSKRRSLLQTPKGNIPITLNKYLGLSGKVALIERLDLSMLVNITHVGKCDYKGEIFLADFNDCEEQTEKVVLFGFFGH